MRRGLQWRRRGRYAFWKPVGEMNGSVREGGFWGEFVAKCEKSLRPRFVRPWSCVGGRAVITRGKKESLEAEEFLTVFLSFWEILDRRFGSRGWSEVLLDDWLTACKSFILFFFVFCF